VRINLWAWLEVTWRCRSVRTILFCGCIQLFVVNSTLSDRLLFSRTVELNWNLGHFVHPAVHSFVKLARSRFAIRRNSLCLVDVHCLYTFWVRRPLGAWPTSACESGANVCWYSKTVLEFSRLKVRNENVQLTPNGKLYA